MTQSLEVVFYADNEGVTIKIRTSIFIDNRMELSPFVARWIYGFEVAIICLIQTIPTRAHVFHYDL